MGIRSKLLLVLVALALAGSGCSGARGDESEAAESESSLATTIADQEAVSAFARIPELIASLQPSIVAILVTGPQGGGEGSGVVWDEDGVVVTNHHVIAGATSVQLQLASGERIDARVLATDPLADLAIVATDRTDLPPAPFATEIPTVGELAVALGNPLGFEQTATQGIVSGIQRSLPGGGESGALVDLIQTDAAISPGNSGGALVNGEGEVIGINVAYVPPAAGAVAIGFAIPAPTVREVVGELLADGRATHAYIGIGPGTLTPEIAGQLGLDEATGVLVLDVEPGSPAARAGLRRADVIVSLNGEPVERLEDLLEEVRDREPGDRVRLEVLREGAEVGVELTLGTHPGAR